MTLPTFTPRVWLVHDWLTGMRGGEKVLLQLVRLFPNSRIATLLHVPGATHPEIDARVARTSFLQKMPGAARGYRNYLPVFPRAIRSIRLDGDCDLVISSSHAVAKGVRVPPGVPHVCYCHTPMRYIWGMEDHYLNRRSLKRVALQMATPALRRFDLKNDSVSAFVANSAHVAARIKQFYRRDAVVVYPGVDETYFTVALDRTREDFYLVISALVPYKRVDVAVRAFLAMPARSLVVIGGGPELAKLRQLAHGHANIRFLGRQPDDVLRDHYQRCRAFLFPGEEDFGLTPVEAQACGAPVLAYRAGGALETVVENQTGLFFDQQTAASLQDAIERFEARTFDPALIRENALRFTWAQFDRGIRAAVAPLTSSTSGT